MGAVEAAAAVGAAGVRKPPLRSRAVPYAFVAPAIALVLLVMAYPFVYSVYLSVFHTPSDDWTHVTFAGLGNYRIVFRDPIFYQVLENTIVWTVGSTAIGIALGLVAALAVNNLTVLRGPVRATLLMPYVVGYVVASYAWKWLYQGDYGLIDAELVARHVVSQPIQFLESIPLAMPALILTNVWKTFPFAMLMLLAGLQNVPEQLLQAARLDRATRWRTFWEITVPAIRPVLLVTTMLLALANFNSFTIPWIMTNGGPLYHTEIITNYIYNQAFNADHNFGLAAATSCVTSALLMGFAVVYVRTLTRPRGGR